MEENKNIAPAFIKAMGEIKSITKDSTNPFLKNKYASLDAIIDGTKEVLKKHDLCVFQKVSDSGIETIILHTSGESITSGILSIPAETKNGLSQAQSRGVAITYAKRYQLGALLGISTDEDTDGNDKEKPLPTLSEKGWEKALLRLKSEPELTAKLRMAYKLTKDQDAILKKYENGSTINNQSNPDPKRGSK